MTLAQLRHTLIAVIDYNWVDERDDYRDIEEGRSAHIFRHLVALNNFVHGTTWTPEDYIMEGQS